MLTSSVEVPPDATLASLPSLLDANAILETARTQLVDISSVERDGWQEARLLEATYHPGRHVRVVYAMLSESGVPLNRVWPQGQLVYFNAPARLPMSRRGALLNIAGSNIEAYAFPNDRRLRGLRTFAHRDLALAAWKRWRNENEVGGSVDESSFQRLLMRYVPEHKCVVRLRAAWTSTTGETTTDRLVVRAADVSRCTLLAGLHQRLVAASEETTDSFRVARVVSNEAEHGLLACEWLRGDALIETMSKSNSVEPLAAVATALRQLHSSSLPGLGIQTTPELVVRINDAFIDLCAACPDLVTSLFRLRRQLIQALKQLAPEPLATLHGDFHWKQVVFKGNRPALLDLERMTRGDGLLDVANFATQLEMLAWRPETGVAPDSASRWSESFLDAWAFQSATRIDRGRLSVYAAVARLEWARGMLRHLRPNWRELCAMAVSRAGADLNCAGVITEAA